MIKFVIKDKTIFCTSLIMKIHNVLLHTSTLKKISYQLIPPNVHRRNATERAISIWKNHFVAGLCSTNLSFPIHLWNRLLSQYDYTLNMMRISRLNPALSVYHYLYGQYNFDATPMVPPRTKVLMYITPQTRCLWGPHGEDGWYISPVLKHY